MNVFELLTLRSEYEDLTLNQRIPGDLKSGTLLNMKWYMLEGYGRNKRKPESSRTLEIATMIINNEAERVKRR